MAYKPPVGAICELRMWCTQLGQAAVNTLHYKVLSIVTGGATDAEIALAMDAFIAPLMKAILANTATYKGCSIQVINPLPRKVYQYSTGNAGVGTAGAVPLPAQVSGISFMAAANAGPAYRGRQYWPFPALADSTTGGLPSSSYATRIGLLTTALIQDETVVGAAGTTVLRPVIWHLKAGAGGVPAARSSDEIVTFGTETKFATQRKRGIFGRPNVSPF